MKKHLLALAALASMFHLANAQTEKGRQTLGLYAGITTISNNNAVISTGNATAFNQTIKYTNINIGPSYSYFIANNLDIGASLNYSYSKQEDNYSVTTNQSGYSYGASAYLRKYVLYDNKLGFRTGARAGYGRTNSKYTVLSPGNTTANSENSGDQYYGGLSFELVYYPSSKLGISANVANATYGHYTNKSAANGNGNGDSFTFNFINNGLLLNIFYVIGGKQSLRKT